MAKLGNIENHAKRRGNIWFNLMGLEGSNEAAVDEISMMIDMAKKG